MLRNPIWVTVAGIFAMVPALSLAQQGSTGGSTTRPDQSGGVLSVEGPQMITGEQMRAQVQPGTLIGGTGEGAGALRGTAEAATQSGRNARANTGRQNTRGGLNNMMRAMNNFGFNSRFNQRQQLRVPIRLGFATTSLQPPSPDVGLRVQDRLARIPQLRDNGPLAVEMDGRVAVLRGEVVSQHERELVARLVLLEPGISDVKNELTIASAAAVP
jgi:hypothetical protein